MSEAYQFNPEEIRAHLLRVMSIAADELLVPKPSELYPRFVRWVEPHGVVCRLCGKPSHDYVPGFPPGLFPCKWGPK
jgi:hypothetical protein